MDSHFLFKDHNKMEMSKRKLRTKKRRRHAWNYESEAAFFNLWIERLEEIRSTKKRAHIYSEIAAELTKLGYAFGAREIQIKIQNLVSRYRKEKTAMLAPGGTPTTWKCYHKMHKIVEECNDVLFRGEVKMESIDDYSMTSNPSQYTPLNLHGSTPPASIGAPSRSPLIPAVAVPAAPSAVSSRSPSVSRPPSPDLPTKKKKPALGIFQNAILKRFDQVSKEIGEHLRRCEETDEQLISIEQEKVGCLRKIANDNEELKNAFIFFLKKDSND